MDLKGWDYTGRNIGPEFHKQYRQFCKYLSEPAFVNHQTWGNPLQDKLAKSMNVASSGAIRTIKRMFVNYGFVDKNVLNSQTELYGQDFLTKRGKILLQEVTLEEEIKESDSYPEEIKRKSLVEIKNLYEEVYCDAFAELLLENNDGTRFSPLRATLQALKRYGKMDKWEWYLMNTFIRHDDKKEEITQLDACIELYRNGKISFSMKNVIEKPKGHQYTPQHYDYAGLVHVVQRPEWSISDSNRHKDVKERVLSNDYMTSFRNGGN